MGYSVDEKAADTRRATSMLDGSSTKHGHVGTNRAASTQGDRVFFSPKRQKMKDLKKYLKKISENKEAKKKENWKENNK